MQQEVTLMEQGYTDEIEELQGLVRAQDLNMKLIKDSKDSTASKSKTMEEMYQAQIYNLGLSFMQKKKGTKTWLDQHKGEIYSHNYDYIFNR